MGIFTLKAPTYKAVAEDESLSQEAMMIVVAVAVLNGLVSLVIQAVNGSIVGGLVSAVVTVIFALIGWYAAGWLLAFVAEKFGGKTTMQEMLRVTGYVYAFNIIGVLSILAVISTSLLCLTSPLSLVAAVLGLIGYVIGVREAAEFSTQNAVITAVIVAVIVFIINLIAGGITAAALVMFS
jgi:hypothetical protein